MIEVTGAIDKQGRCKHYHQEMDVVAIKFKCCNIYYGCYFCHEDSANHPAVTWPKQEWDSKAIHCGNCQTELTIQTYLNSNYRCPVCQFQFNPKCANHSHLYFEADSVSTCNL
ncbi:CHY zinc finger protein [Paenibacillus sp. ACRRX]|uniref:CHY zinc finger protein n=1 Tax=unclassified Paenibacillus TaxID=185978 RepID=UPI001EF5B783|nr:MULTISPECIES: CHY zinc finger protein [unclassified Paenibacillus]MCG7406153.1 CHY zinc finger protein [Paenibacillus sp. ACRRX]MDK8182607.1 CHY zinc finger protein [Paenibacillus sp. UMB4589-SE434]